MPMQRLDLYQSDLPDLQFVLMVGALCTADLQSINVPASVRNMVFDRCWALLHEGQPPTQKSERVLNLMEGDEVTLEALVNIIRHTFEEHGFSELTWEQQPSEPSRESTPEVLPLVERIQQLYPPPDDVDPSSGMSSSSS